MYLAQNFVHTKLLNEPRNTWAKNSGSNSLNWREVLPMGVSCIFHVNKAVPNPRICVVGVIDDGETTKDIHVHIGDK